MGILTVILRQILSLGFDTGKNCLIQETYMYPPTRQLTISKDSLNVSA